MPKVLVCGKGGSGKSTLVALLARTLVEQGKPTLVVDADESNLSLDRMLGVDKAGMSLIDYLGGRPVVGKQLMQVIMGQGSEQMSLFDEPITLDTLPPECSSWKDQPHSEAYLRRELEQRAIPIGGVLQHSPAITGDNLVGHPVSAGEQLPAIAAIARTIDALAKSS